MHVYAPLPWGHEVALWVMPVATVLLTATYLPGQLREAVRHPMLLSILLWATSHLLANGDLASVLLFGGFAAFAVFDLVSQCWREPRPRRAPRRWADILTLLVGGLGYWLALYLHTLAGRPVN